MTHQILLYYSYVILTDPEALAGRQRELCQRLGLKGRLIIAAEGINGTLEGTIEQTEKYIELSAMEPSFRGMVYKRSEGTGSAFPKLSVRVRPEIVSAHLKDPGVNPVHTAGTYLEPDTLHQWIRSDKEFYIVDMRNDYEHASGHFQGSLLAPISNFRALAETLPVVEHLKNKTVVTVCTGGVRCEKASGFLVQHGFTDVHQLHDGIVSYMERYPNEDYLGSLYVFDSRVTMAFDGIEPHTVIGKCERCSQPSERYVNCVNTTCNRHFICCQECTDGTHTHCRDSCQLLNIA